MLEGWGYRVVAVENPDVAAALLEKDAAFDLLFTDIVMPGTMTAVELAELAQRLRPGIAVLLTSGYARGPDSRTRPVSDYPDDRQALSQRGAGGQGARRAGGAAARAAAVGDGYRESLHRHRRADLPRRVLLVEDEVVLRMSTTDMLERLGCSVAGVGSGEQALELLARDGGFDLLLTDLGLPGMSGEELAAEVRRRFPSAAGGHCQRLRPARACRRMACSSSPSPIRRSTCNRPSITPPGRRRLTAPIPPPIARDACNPARTCGVHLSVMGQSSEGEMKSKQVPADVEHADTRSGRIIGPLDGELLDLYVAILIVVPIACLLRSSVVLVTA